MKYGDKAKHGWSRQPEFHAWQSMIQRCTNPESDSYARYGGRGISVCERWMFSFEAFLSDMGPRPSPDHSLDRRDNDGWYTPANCRWSTGPVQASNRSTNVRITLGDKTQTIAEWARDLGITRQALRFRLLSEEWTIEDALTYAGKRQVRGEKHKLAKLSDLDVASIRRLRAQGVGLSAISREFGVSEARISKLCRKAAK